MRKNRFPYNLRVQEPGVETLERCKRWPSIRRQWSIYHVRIYSLEHSAYWKPEGAGYTCDGLQAGIFPFDEAYKMTNHCGPEKGITYILVL